MSTWLDPAKIEPSLLKDAYAKDLVVEGWTAPRTEPVAWDGESKDKKVKDLGPFFAAVTEGRTVTGLTP